MKIKRFLAADIRTALQQVKESLGPDAVILSNRKTDEGVEIVAARDFEVEAVTEGQDKSDDTLLEESPKGPPSTQVTPNPAFSAKGYGAVAEMVSEAKRQGSSPAKRIRQPKFPRVTETDIPHFPGESYSNRKRPAEKRHDLPGEKMRQTSTPAPDALAPLRREIQQMRRLLDRHLSQTSLQEEVQNHPTRLDLMRALTEKGFSRHMVLELARRGGNEEEFEAAWRRVRQVLISQIPVVHDPLLDHGGIVALVGPTGVGKTTTIAKLAARFRLKHGPRQLALVTTDNYRIAAHEQLSTYARILGVPVRVAANTDELHAILRSFVDKRLVLIDTAGMGQRDGRLAEQFALLRDSEIAIETHLVLSAASQLHSLYEAMEAFAEFQPKAGIITKLDEAGCVGPILSALIERGLPTAFMTDGQQVPEDLHLACAETLVARGFDSDAHLPVEAMMERGLEDWMHYASATL